MGDNLECLPPKALKPKMALAIIEEPMSFNTSALATGNRLLEKYKYPPNDVLSWGLEHSEAFLFAARQVRNLGLCDFLAADEAANQLRRNALRGGIERPVAIAMLTALYRRLGEKMNEEGKGKVEGAMYMLESDDIGRASGLWKPLGVTPAILALACLKLINVAVYPPKPAEVRAACEEASNALRQAYRVADKLCEKVLKADAILLEFDYAEWSRPWLLPAYHPIRARMVLEHSISERFGSYDEEGSDPPSTFQRLVLAEEAKLALEAKPKQLAAARKRSEAKRSRKLNAANGAV